MVTTGARYVVDARGRKTAVVLGIREYQRLMKRLEDLEDALTLDKAVEIATDFRNYREIQQELKQEGRL